MSVKDLNIAVPGHTKPLQQKSVFRIHPNSLHPNPDPSPLLNTDPDLIQVVDESRSNMDPDPDPDPDQGLCKKKIFFGSKTVMYIFLNPYNGHSGSSPTENSSNMKFLDFFLFWGTILECLYPDPDSDHPHHLNPDPFRFLIRNAGKKLKLFKLTNLFVKGSAQPSQCRSIRI